MATSLDLYKRSRLTYRTNVTEIEDGQGVKKGIFMLKKSQTDADTLALVTIEISEAPATQGQIVNDGLVSGTAILEFVIDEDDLDAVAVGKYTSGVKAILDNDHAHIVPDSIRPTFVCGAMVEDID